jgi:hypothetical protein
VQNGLRHGQGKTIYDNGSVYSGSYVNDISNGEGVWHDFVNGREYSYFGEWVNGQQHGRGVLHQYLPLLDAFVSIEGTFHDELPEGASTWTITSGARTGEVYFRGEMMQGDFQRGQLDMGGGESYRGGFNDKNEYEGQSRRSYIRSSDFCGTAGCHLIHLYVLLVSLSAGIGLRRHAGGHYTYGVHTNDKLNGPAVTFLPASASENTAFRIFVMISAKDVDEARWFKKTAPSAAAAAAASATTAASSSSGEPTAESDLVWRYVQQLIADGLRAVIRWREEEGIHGAAPVPKISDAEINAVVSVHLREFSSSSAYDLYGRPWSLAKSVKFGVCQYRFSEDIPTHTAYYRCEKCSQNGAVWSVCEVSSAHPQTRSEHLHETIVS